jgi:hypothetical protein
VAATGNGFLGGGGDPEQHITQWVAATDLVRAVQKEPARSVVQQRGVGGP